MVTIWQNLAVAFVGGDARETEMAYIAAGAGATVRVFGCPAPDGSRVTVADSLAHALDGARIAVLPVPYSAIDGSLYAPFADAPIHVGAAELSKMSSDAHVIIGKSDEALASAAREAGVSVHEYENDTDLMLLRAPAIAEGAIKVAIERSPLTIHDTPIGLIGFGRIGQTLARGLLALNGRLHVFARRPEARAAAYAMGASSHALEDIPKLFPDLEIVYNCVPAPVLSDARLAHLRAGSLVIDLAAPPGGVDREAAEARGLVAVWARGLGASAPRSVARSQWTGVERIVSAALST